MHPNKPIKQLFNANDTWLNYLNKYRETLRTVVIENVTKMLACSTAAFAAVVASKPQSGGYESNNMSFLSVSINTLP